MALGGGPPILSLLTGAARGVTAGRKDAMERQREAVLNQLRQLQMQSAAQGIQYARTAEARAAEMHERTIMAQDAAAAAAEAETVTDRQDANTIARRLRQQNPELGMSDAFAQAQAIVNGRMEMPEDPAQTDLDRREQEADIRQADASAALSRARAAEIAAQQDRVRAVEVLSQDEELQRQLRHISNYRQFDDFVQMPAVQMRLQQHGLLASDLRDAWLAARETEMGGEGGAVVAGQAMAARALEQANGDPDRALFALSEMIDQAIRTGSHGPMDSMVWEAAMDYLDEALQETRLRGRRSGGGAAADIRSTADAARGGN